MAETDSRDFGKTQRSDGTIPGDLLGEDEYVQIIGWRGDASDQARERIFKVDALMRQYYDACRDDVAAKLSPAVVVQFDLSGGIWTLIHGDTRETIDVQPGVYEELKSLCHIPLGIYAIVAPYLRTPDSDGWRGGLTEFREAIQDALDTIKQVGLEPEALKSAQTICTLAVDYADSLLKGGRFDLDGYREFTASALPSIKVLLPIAGRDQASTAISLLERWREQLGDDWKSLTGIVLAPYTLSVDNAAAQCLKYVMDPEFVQDRLVVLQGDFKNEIGPALEVVAHLYMDRLVARLVFGEDTEENRTLTDSLSSERDLVADAAAAGVEEIAYHESCPRTRVGSIG